MPSIWSSIAAKGIAEHEFVTYFGVDGIDISAGPEMTFRQLAHRDCPIPDDQYDALQNRYGDEFVWRQAEPDTDGRTAFAIGKDLHPHIREILSGARTDLATRWIPTETAIKLVSRADLYPKPEVNPRHISAPPAGHVRKTLHLRLAPRAKERMRAVGFGSRMILLNIGEFDLTLFDTMKGLLKVRLTFRPLDKALQINPLEFLECAYALSHHGALQWTATGNENQVIGEPFSLVDLMRSLCYRHIKLIRPSSRLFAYSFVRFDDDLPTDHADIFGLYAARRYNSDYEIADKIEGVRRVRDFVAVGHTLSLEGGATVISNPEARALPEFLKTWRSHTFQTTYLPIVTLALHEHQFLVEKTSTALLTPQQRCDPFQVRALFLALTRDFSEFSYLLSIHGN